MPSRCNRLLDALGVWLVLSTSAHAAPPASADLLYNRAKEYLRTGREGDAIKQFRKVLGVEPRHLKARQELAFLEQKHKVLRDQAMDDAVRLAQRGHVDPRPLMLVDEASASAAPSLETARIAWAQARQQAMEEALGRARAEALAEEPPAPPQPQDITAPAGGPSVPAPTQRVERVPTPAEERPLPPGELTGMARALSKQIVPLLVSGEVRSTLGVTRDDVILQEANGDLNERNFRVFSGPLRYNTFDPRVFSRTRVTLDTNETTNWQLHSNVTVDPWSFVGKTDRFTVVGDTPTDTVELELKWWSATNTAINETFFTQNNGDSLATPEIETSEGRTVPTAVTSVFSNIFRIPSAEIDYTFQPIRWLWTGYKNDVVDFRVFPLALQDQALTSDDPLRLSNHHIYWEPSPWLDEWIPGRLNTGATPDDFTRGRWSDDLSFFTRDSDLTRLTALRGTSLQWTPAEGTLVQAALASPKGLWQEYERFNNVLAMARVKQELLDGRLTFGGTHTSRWAYTHQRKDATNHVYALDTTVTPWPWLTWEGEVAASKTIQDRVSAFESDTRGWAWHNALTGQVWNGHLTGRIFYTHMDEGFDPGLANYRNTRKDQFWGRHLRFKRKPSLFTAISPVASLSWGDIDAVRIGDGVDVGREAWGLRLTGSFFESRLEPLFDLRNVHRPDGKYVETVVREENTVKPADWLTAKTLFIYHDLPHTIGGIDPFLVNADTNRSYTNAAIVDDRDPSLLTFSVGAEVAPHETLSFWGVWERTNDTTVATDNFPRGLLDGSTFATFNEDDQVIRVPETFVFSQGFFPLPPYPFFDIFRAGVSVEPIDEQLQVSIDWTRNEFELAGQIDDNLNHLGFMAAWSPLKRLIVAGRYVISWAVDVADMNAGTGKRFTKRHSLFGRLMWECTEGSNLFVDFGEAALGPSVLFSIDPYGDYYPTLDTEHFVRITYTTVF